MAGKSKNTNLHTPGHKEEGPWMITCRCSAEDAITTRAANKPVCAPDLPGWYCGKDSQTKENYHEGKDIALMRS